MMVRIPATIATGRWSGRRSGRLSRNGSATRSSSAIVGPFLASVLRGGSEIGGDTLARFYSIHMLIIPGAIFALIGLHLYLVIRLGVTSPPWSKDAAGEEPADGVSNGRVGLTQPVARGTGGRD